MRPFKYGLYCALTCEGGSEKGLCGCRGQAPVFGRRGWRCIGEAGGGSWSRKGRPRVDTHPLQTKLRWEAA